jgi:AcrR family transcriptional regulator
MSRRYVQRARADAAQETRRQILDAARAELLAGSRLTFAVGEIAARAGVARSTVYAAFGSRAGLIRALADDTLKRAGLDAVIAGYQRPEAVSAMEQSLAASCRMYAAEHPVFRRLHVLAQVDPEAAGPLGQSHGDRAVGLTDLTRRLAAQGHLRAGISPAMATDALWVLSGFWAFDDLATGRGRDVDSCAELLVAMARDALLDR